MANQLNYVQFLTLSMLRCDVVAFMMRPDLPWRHPAPRSPVHHRQ